MDALFLTMPSPRCRDSMYVYVCPNPRLSAGSVLRAWGSHAHSQLSLLSRSRAGALLNHPLPSRPPPPAPRALFSSPSASSALRRCLHSRSASILTLVLLSTGAPFAVCDNHFKPPNNINDNDNKIHSTMKVLYITLTGLIVYMMREHTPFKATYDKAQVRGNRGVASLCSTHLCTARWLLRSLKTPPGF